MRSEVERASKAWLGLHARGCVQGCAQGFRGVLPREAGLFEKIRADYRRHNKHLLNPSLWILAVYRYGVWAGRLPAPARWAADKIYGALSLGVQLATGSFVPRETNIGESPHLIHFFDIRIHPKVIIGDRVGIMHDVTIATTQNRDGAPIIGNDVFIGPGSVIIGPVNVGDGATIAPNSLVISDIPPGCTAMGVPAKARRIALDLEPAESPPQQVNGRDRSPVTP